MSGATCATCRHFRKRLDGPNGHCYRFPPREGDIAITYPGEMFCGEHAPTPAVGAPAKAAELPDGWRWTRDTLPGHARAQHVTYDLAVMVDDVGCIHADEAPIAVVEAAIAWWRAGGAA